MYASDTLVQNKSVNKYQDEKERIHARKKGYLVPNKTHIQANPVAMLKNFVLPLQPPQSKEKKALTNRLKCRSPPRSPLQDVSGLLPEDSLSPAYDKSRMEFDDTEGKIKDIIRKSTEEINDSI